ncbi:C-C motif chemokine 14 Chemokine CC-1/CC-3 [Channa argus]|uniref:C-C motif chemokine 14 Chemokine CC-1/CC-3 n=1 Tax=Channa argus TaxID=215402 RepID=A0A6G1Q5B3_CHAAH|nr:C-C motif chemokine 14 Chemokine CC-1/CC-3 [Channa argus]
MKNILLLCILGAALVSTVVCQTLIGPKECCFDFYPRRIKKDLIRSYYMTDNQCSKTGIILVTARSHICMDPADAWVQSIKKTLDEKSL